MKKLLLVVLTLFSFAFNSGAMANNLQSFNQAQFEKDKSENKKIVLQFHLSTCPSCVQQKESLERVVSLDEFKDIVFYSVDYKHDKDTLRAYNIKEENEQSTLIFFNGSKETARSKGNIQYEQIKTFMDINNK